MIYELRHYKFTPEKWSKYLKLFNDKCLPIRLDNYGILKGKWNIEQDGYIHFYHLWQYESLEHRHLLRQELAKIQSWQEDFIQYAAPLIHEQDLKVLNLTDRNNNFNFQRNLNIYEIDCKVSTLKNVINSVAENNKDNIQLNIVEFPNPNEIILFSESQKNIENLNIKNIKHTTLKMI
ncbi:NIPSNAP family protein [Acinetobacter baumannii]|nr:NIPSNAP family protein [Acinetobacter baumannii]EKU2514223.1 NIPSNAP family protein [Acinetobacter baumannii]EKU5629490.1 NIPSNAP family protein [Acinetobacter baumannii]EKV1635839.1 NIPSNAP family protein [Acinetobacter baumannii]EKW8164342.1 NIPSNAP family protein [Acinetobacter baumannii]